MRHFDGRVAFVTGGASGIGGWLTEVTGTKIGTWPVAEGPVKMSRTPPYIGGMIDRGAPCYGEDNEYVVGEILGYTTGQIQTLRADGVI